MEAHEFVDDDDIVWQIDWNDLPDFTGILEEQAPAALTVSPPNQGFSNPSPDSVCSWIGEVENLLMNDDAEEAGLQPDTYIYDDFLLDIPVHSPTHASIEVVASGNSNRSSQATADDDPHKQNNRITVQETGTDVLADVAADSPISGSTELGPTPTAANNSDVSSHGSGNGDLEKVQEAIKDVGNPDDPVSKKRRRQLRNRDAAVKSRERKKIYVKDLEMKSRYLEGECRRLGRLLQCFVAENQALRLSLQRGSAFDASSAKQESAVLLLESLLLGSLLWFLGIICLFNLPRLPKSIVEAVPVESAEKKSLGGLAAKGAGSNVVVESFLKNRGCKASRTKMKLEILGLQVSA
ncbi:hypothetical protein SLA2020_458530 [Shorea laevis]